jgi:Uma2 family endonuclease
VEENDTMSRDLGEVLTVEQFFKLPEIKPALEFCAGRVVQRVSPKRSHVVLSDRLWNSLYVYVTTRRLGWVASELRCTFGGDSVVPDVCFIERSRIPRDSRGRQVEDVMVAPDLMIEIVSPGQTVAELENKLTRSIRNGVRLGWLVRPRQRQIRVFRPGRTPETLGAGQTLSGEDVVPGFRLKIDEIFAWLDED